MSGKLSKVLRRLAGARGVKLRHLVRDWVKGTARQRGVARLRFERELHFKRGRRATRLGRVAWNRLTGEPMPL